MDVILAAAARPPSRAMCCQRQTCDTQRGSSFLHSILVTSSRGCRAWWACRRGCHEDATRKRVLWNLNFNAFGIQLRIERYERDAARRAGPSAIAETCFTVEIVPTCESGNDASRRATEDLAVILTTSAYVDV